MIGRERKIGADGQVRLRNMGLCIVEFIKNILSFKSRNCSQERNAEAALDLAWVANTFFNLFQCKHGGTRKGIDGEIN